MRKSVSLNNLSEYQHTADIPKIIAEDEKNKTSSGYASADDAVPISSSRERKRGYCRESTSCSCLSQVLSFALQVVLESACKDDEELRAVLGDSIGNPELMRKKVTIGSDFQDRFQCPQRIARRGNYVANAGSMYTFSTYRA
ncbi:hypothetical protein Bca52824_087695 [Brassica carinata]|uniref:Uncharacterized protein n=1 Tax=Brassica carinata TaxID=52824 RepID=A0A8X7PCE3_BRACI|nr:hypothetical protein Bca52824_087695 [Brassica carinata]